MLLDDVRVTCPSCWETITLEIDVSAGDQEYIEDCPVCCAPLRVIFHTVDGVLESVNVEPSG